MKAITWALGMFIFWLCLHFFTSHTPSAFWVIFPVFALMTFNELYSIAKLLKAKN